MKQVFDPVRLSWVSATPEEVVRQKCLQFMLTELSFPKHLLSVERSIDSLQHLSGPSVGKIPSRRIDIVSFYADLKPLLLIECKRGQLTRQALVQALAYNSFIHAPYVAIANGESIWMQYKGERSWEQIEFLPSYRDLTRALGFVC